MSVYIIEWLTLLLRWAHVITGIAWIGSSFYFIWLDAQLNVPPRDPEAIAECLEYLRVHPDRRREMCRNARERALNFTWEAYRNRVGDFVQEGRRPSLPT